MSREGIPLPKEPIPKVYLNVQQTNASETVDHDIKNEKGPDTLPPKNLYGQNLKRLKSYRLLRKNFKMNEIKTAFIQDVSQVLLSLDPNGQNRYDTELLIAVLNLAEQFFIYPGNGEERDTLKLEAVKELMLPFFNNNEEMLLAVMGSVLHKVVRSNVFKRMWARMKLYFRA